MQDAMVSARRHGARFACDRTTTGVTRWKSCHHHDQGPYGENKKMNKVLDHSATLLDRKPRRNHVTP
jgi:hypothetical protein